MCMGRHVKNLDLQKIRTHGASVYSASMNRQLHSSSATGIIHIGARIMAARFIIDVNLMR